MNRRMEIKNFLKIPVLTLKKTEYLSALACRLIQWTSKYPEPIHPKHLVHVRPVWYLPFLKSTFRVLDIGCNNGQHTLRVATQVKYVVGIDYDDRALSIAKRLLQRKKYKNVFLKKVDVKKKLPFKSREFDAVLFLDVLEHLSNRESILQEIHRVLKKNGYLFLSVPNSDTTWKKLQRRLNISSFSDPDHKVEFTKSEIKRIVKYAKFTVKQISPVTLDTPWVGFIDFIGGISLFLYRRLSKWRRNEALKKPQESIGFELVCLKN